MGKSRTQVVLEGCALFDWKGPGFCGACNKDLGKPNRRWCGRSCTNRFLENHSWGDARKAAVKRDKSCVTCGRDGTIPEDLTIWIRFMEGILYRHPDRFAMREWTREALRKDPQRWRRMGWRKAERVRRKEFFEETGIMFEYWREDFYKSVRMVQTNHRLEVNHITPVKGRHAEYGCLHHLENLETLCGECHKKVTKRQREEGLLK